ncbi:hypothetical protein [Puniceibacterium confluentis]|uniref:hypothetical protein n=1 Tax=Puniceibacterium confluentis TaxID=1958944 RepID=UPI0011B7731E|nr:hypothetical protein [Puniceibacterium confluentis]
MSAVEVLGRDVAAEACRIRVRVGGTDVVALVPEVLMQGLRPGERPSHQESYEWIARHGRQLQAALTTLHQGGTPRRPFDVLILEAPAHGR